MCDSLENLDQSGIIVIIQYGMDSYLQLPVSCITSSQQISDLVFFQQLLQLQYFDKDMFLISDESLNSENRGAIPRFD